MKKSAKITSFLAAAAMFVSMFAVAAHATDPSKTGAMTITGLEKGATVTPYQIIRQNEDTQAYELATSATDLNFTVEDIVKKGVTDIPTKETLEKIRAACAAGKFTAGTAATADNSGTASFANQDCGTYFMSVASANYIYNPMVVSVQWDKENGSLAADTKVSGIAKASPVGQKKEITTYADPENKNGADHAIGDAIGFKVETVLPTYDKETYKTVVYKINDTLDAGLTPPADTAISVATTGADITGSYTATVSGQTLTVALDSDYVLENGGATITVTYNATLNENAKFNFDENKNQANVTYTNNPDPTVTPGETPPSITHHYTFGFNASLDGSTTNISEDFIKTGEDITSQDTTKTEHGPLSGAKFALYKTNTIPAGQKLPADTDLAPNGANLTTDADGKISVTGLDGSTLYYLYETEAPTGYTRITDPVTIEFVPVYNEDGTLASYDVKFNGTVQTGYTLDNGTVVKKTSGQKPFELVDTKLDRLPTTGGIGTYIFTILGVVIMAVAAGLFFIRRRRVNG